MIAGLMIVLIILISSFLIAADRFLTDDRVIKRFPEKGYEIRQNKVSIWVHITDQKAYRENINKMTDALLKDFNKKESK